MSQAIYLLLEVPAGHQAGLPDIPDSPADWQRLLASSRLRLVSGQPRSPEPGAKPSRPVPREKDDAGAAVKSLEEVERDYIIEILSRSGGNRSQAARMLNISRRTLQRKMARFG